MIKPYKKRRGEDKNQREGLQYIIYELRNLTKVGLKFGVYKGRHIARLYIDLKIHMKLINAGTDTEEDDYSTHKEGRDEHCIYDMESDRGMRNHYFHVPPSDMFVLIVISNTKHYGKQLLTRYSKRWDMLLYIK